jgi:uncharacterized protein (DUF1501 family)
MHCDRRRFLSQTLHSMLGASVYSAFGNLQLVHAATRSAARARMAGANTAYSFGDYKALICVFLYGGNDSFNMVIPTDAPTYAKYQTVRPSLAVAQNQLLALNAPTSGQGSPGDGGQYGFHPAMTDLATLFNQASSPVAIIANVGTLVGPVTKAQYQSSSAALPPQLFSHADQLAYWQSSPPSNIPETGWGGRIGDLLASVNPANLPMVTSLNTEDAFIRGLNQNNYIMGVDSASALQQPYDSDGSLSSTFGALYASGVQANVLERTYAATMNHSQATAGIINNALNATGASNPPPNWSTFFPNPTGYDLDTQLMTVARLIWAANNGVTGYTGQKRQVFFVTTGGYDTHSGETDAQPALLGLLSKSLAGFYKALHSVGLDQTATAFTASDFGRTLSTNGNGTDHGWGSHHIVVGGAVGGGKFYGDNLGGTGNAAMPSLLLSDKNPNDAGYGQIIPTTSIDQYSATLASWFGVAAGDIPLLFPNLSNFSTQNLGFV